MQLTIIAEHHIFSVGKSALNRQRKKYTRDEKQKHQIYISLSLSLPLLSESADQLLLQRLYHFFSQPPSLFLLLLIDLLHQGSSLLFFFLFTSSSPLTTITGNSFTTNFLFPLKCTVLMMIRGRGSVCCCCCWLHISAHIILTVVCGLPQRCLQLLGKTIESLASCCNCCCWLSAFKWVRFFIKIWQQQQQQKEKRKMAKRESAWECAMCPSIKGCLSHTYSKQRKKLNEKIECGKIEFAACLPDWD